MKTSAICRIIGFLLLLTSPVRGAESQSQLISDFRVKHGEPGVVRDAILDRIALEQARAMAAKDQLSHDVLGPFIRRIAPARAGRAAENIAYGFDSFEKTLGQWIESPDHRRNLLLRNASRVGIASARDTSGKRTYWAMVIADSDEPKPTRKKNGNSLERPQRVATPSARSSDSACRIKLLNLCI